MNWDYIGGSTQDVYLFHRSDGQTCWRRASVTTAKSKRRLTWNGSPGFEDRDCTKAVFAAEEFKDFDANWQKKNG